MTVMRIYAKGANCDADETHDGGLSGKATPRPWGHMTTGHASR